jgi:hypothetical protein
MPCQRVGWGGSSDATRPSAGGGARSPVSVARRDRTPPLQLEATSAGGDPGDGHTVPELPAAQENVDATATPRGASSDRSGSSSPVDSDDAVTLRGPLRFRGDRDEHRHDVHASDGSRSTEALRQADSTVQPQRRSAESPRVSAWGNAVVHDHRALLTQFSSSARAGGPGAMPRRPSVVGYAGRVGHAVTRGRGFGVPTGNRFAQPSPFADATLQEDSDAGSSAAGGTDGSDVVVTIQAASPPTSSDSTEADSVTVSLWSPSGSSLSGMMDAHGYVVADVSAAATRRGRRPKLVPAVSTFNCVVESLVCVDPKSS